MWLRVGGGMDQPMKIIMKFYNITRKYTNVDKGGGVKCLSINVDKRRVF